ncbi:MAG: hypothetical protein WBE72_24880 [Terracidiphilus sp.]
MKPILRGLMIALFVPPATLVAQLPAARVVSSPGFFTIATDPEPGAGSDGGGQAEPSAYADRYLTRASLGGSLSNLGTGGELATNLPYRLDLRLIGNFTDFNYKFTRSGFYIVLNIAMANTGALVDYYPWKSLRISPGILFFNTDNFSGTVTAETGATITVNDTDYTSDNANPLRGVGHLLLGGTGFMATAGWGHYVARKEKHWSYPFEGGAAFIDKPSATFSLQGDVCTIQGTGCLPAASFPGFESNLTAEVASWNRRAAPYHVYPLVEGGIAYTFRYRK